MTSSTQPGSQAPTPFGQGPAAARVLRRVIDVAAMAGGRPPPELSVRLATIGGTLEWAVRRRKRRVLAENLRHALGPEADERALTRATRQEIINEGRRSADLLWAIAHPERAARAIRVEGMQTLRAALARGRGLILAGPHIGGWETIVPLVSTVPDVSVTALVEDDWLAWAMDDVRRRSGLEIVSISEPPLRALNALRAGQVLIVLADVAQPQMRTVEVTLLDAPIRLPAGPAALARISGAPIVPFAALPIDTRAWRMWTGTPIEPPARRSGRDGETAAMQQLADSWSAVIRAHPTQWAAVYPLPWLDGRAR
jgi:lauroyl/myristoyl acyltransferase